MEKQYLPTTPEGRLWRLAEEANEVATECLALVKHCCKAGRFGLDGDSWATNPDRDTPRERIRKTIEKLQQEQNDLSHAIACIALDIDL